jgi:replicative DNA helicase
MQANQETGNLLPIKSQTAVLNETHKEIVNSWEGKELVLKSRWAALNKALLGGFRFNNNVLLAGPSGHGKSYMLNMLRDDFTSELNAHLRDKIKVLHFGWEMSSVDETVRTLVGRTKIPYEEILSCFQKLDQNKYSKIKENLKELAERPIYYIEKSGNKYDIMKTIYAFQKKFPEHKLVILLDHTLLTEYFDEPDEVKLIADLGKIFINIRKDIQPLVIMLGQFNDKIEDPKRITTNILHYPRKTDIHGSKQLFQAVDVVLTCYQPALIGIDEYGPKFYRTEDLIAVHLLKMRKGKPGLIRLRSDFENGTFTDWADEPKNYGITI